MSRPSHTIPANPNRSASDHKIGPPLMPDKLLTPLWSSKSSWSSKSPRAVVRKVAMQVTTCGAKVCRCCPGRTTRCCSGYQRPGPCASSTSLYCAFQSSLASLPGPRCRPRVHQAADPNTMVQRSRNLLEHPCYAGRWGPVVHPAQKSGLRQASYSVNL
jgi:hypothetical protein